MARDWMCAVTRSSAQKCAQNSHLMCFNFNERERVGDTDVAGVVGCFV